MKLIPNLSPYSKYLKVLAIIPVLVGLLTIVEIFLPLEIKTTVLVNKHERTSLKSASTTYTLEFEGANDQFSEEIYNSIKIGDSATLYYTPYSRETREISIKGGNRIENKSGDRTALTLIGIAFMLTALVWTRSGWLKETPAKWTAIAIVFAVIHLIRIINV